MEAMIDGIKRNIRALSFENGKLKLIDQRKLPHSLEFFECKSAEDVCFAIQNMIVRGAPLIGLAGAYGTYFAYSEFMSGRIEKKEFYKKVEMLRNARPTAVDLLNMIEMAMRATDSMRISGKYSEPAMVLERIKQMEKGQEEACRRIGEYGEKMIRDGDCILTHCNAGALATIEYGTALAPIRFAHGNKKKIFVYVDETRPRLQGALTSWELLNEGIPHKVIADNARGILMKNKKIKLVIVGADRICAKDGSFANKIGTYEIAVLAHENNIPFYVAAPISTFDFSSTEKTIPIEERSEEEVLFIDEKRIFVEGVRAYNPAFDVTPGKYVTSYITEKGILKRKELMNIMVKI